MSTHNLCKHLRTKSMYIPALAHEAAQNPNEAASHSSHCWCNSTLTETGPDDRPVQPHICQPDRSCFED